MEFTNPWNSRQAYEVLNYFQRIAAGEFGDKVIPIRRFGKDSDVGTSWEMLSNVSEEHHYLTEAVQLKIASDDSNDTDGGSGAHKIHFKGLDADFVLQE